MLADVERTEQDLDVVAAKFVCNSSVSRLAVPILIVICGATATGKSGLAIALAERLLGEQRLGNPIKSLILSADSRQVYREFDIGTAKPSIADQQRVPHALIDICAPTTTLTLAEYQQQAQELIAGVSPDVPLLVGGTGLYIRSIVRGLLIPRVAPQPELRSQLQAIGQSQCYAFLQQVDRVAAQKIHSNDQVRTLRALEVFYATGQPISAQQGEFPPSYPILQIGLDCLDVETLGQRIQRRTAQMLADGFVVEVEALCRKYGTALPLLNTLGYQEIKQYLAGEYSLAEAEALIELHTRQFAKQQRTWFRGDRAIEWFDADAPDLLDQVWARVEEFTAALQR